MGRLVCENGEQGKLAFLFAVGCLGNTPASLPKAHLSRAKVMWERKGRPQRERERGEMKQTVPAMVAWQECVFSHGSSRNPGGD